MAFDEDLPEDEAPEVDDVAMEPEGDAPEESLLPPDYDSDPNLAKVLPYEFLEKLAAKVIESGEYAYKSSEGWRNKTAEHMRLYNGDIPDAGTDQENITPMHLPFAKRAVRTFKSKLFPSLYPAEGDHVHLKVRSPMLQPIADKVSAHMNFQITNQNVEYVPSHDRGMTQVLIEGTIFETWRYDVLQKRSCQDIHLAEDFWIPYTAKSDRSDMADIAFKTLRHRYEQHQLEALEAADYYIGVTKPFQHIDGRSTDPIFAPEDAYSEAGTPTDAPGETTASVDTPVKDVIDENIGLEKQGSTDPDGQREFWEQDRMVKLPGETEARMLTICLDRSTGRILRAAFCEMVDLADKARFNREMAAKEAADQAADAMYQQAMMAHSQPILDEVTGAPIAAPAQMGMPAPLPPERAPDPAPVKRVPWHRHTRYDCDVNPGGALGHGILHDVAGHNILANKVATRMVSLSTLNMLPTFIYSRQSRFGRDDFQLKLGKGNESPLPPQQVQAGAGMFQFQFPPPDPNGYKIIDLADKSCQEVTAFDIASGGPGMSGETATESEMRHSNATDNISAVAQRYNRARAASLKNLAYINALTLPDEGEMVYFDGEEIRVYREDYEAVLSELEVTFTCDPTMASRPLRERRAKELVMAVVQATSPHPALMVPVVSPPTAVMMLRLAQIEVLKAMGAPAEMAEMIKNDPMPFPQGPTPMEPGGPPQGADPNGAPPEGAGPPGGEMDGGGPPQDGGQPPGAEGPPMA